MSEKILQGQAALEAVAHAPEHMVAEVLDGVLHTSPRPRIRHARAASVLGAKLGPFDGDGEPGGWIILDEPELHLGVGPDILEVFELDGESYRLVGTWAGQDDVAAPPFAALALALGDLWLG